MSVHAINKSLFLSKTPVNIKMTTKKNQSESLFAMFDISIAEATSEFAEEMKKHTLDNFNQ